RAARQRRPACRERREDPPGGDSGRRHGPRMGRLLGRRRRADARRQGADGHSNIVAVATTQVITPRRTRLVRVPDLHSFRRAIVGLAASALTAEGAEIAGARFSTNREPANPESRIPNPSSRIPSVLVVVPTRSAARQLMRAAPSIDAVTRDELYDRLCARLEDPPWRLTPLERDVM